MDQLVNCPLKSWQSLMGFTLMQWRAVYMILMGVAEKLQMPIWNGIRLLPS